MKTLTRTTENVHFYVDSRNQPKLRVEPGESFRLETIRADNMFLNHSNPVFKDHKEVMQVQANPVTGPVYVENAEPGDLLAVTIEDIRLGDSGNEGYYTYVPGQGVFANRFAPEAFPPDTRFCDVSGKTLTLKLGNKKIETAVEPFIGTICVAMKDKVTLSFEANREMVGNIDCSSVKKGCTMVMPVNVPGALLSLGDLHAKQGDGELLGCAVESDGVVTLQAALIKKQDKGYFNWPHIDDDRYIGSVCTAPNNIEEAIRGATYDIIKRVEADGNIPFMDAYMLAGQCLRIRICQMITGACTAYAFLERNLVESLRR
ncbi:acetamidase [Spirochaetia bacterium]|nr:acetamidase [Spirochaetia bacterium]